MTNSKIDFNLLIVDDDKIQIKNYNRLIKKFNDQSEIEISIKPIIKETFIDGLVALENPNIDGAIVDLKLSGKDGSTKGNDIVRQIKGILRFPVIVYTGSTASFDRDLADPSPFLKIVDRTSMTFEEVLDNFYSLYKMGVTKLIGRNGIIDKSLTKIFWDYLSRSLDSWIKEETTDNIEKIMARYTMAHLHDYLELDEKGDFENYHPSEMYIIPPIRKKPFTGDICVDTKGGKTYIILTPACELANKAQRVVLAEIEDVEMDYVKQIQSQHKEALINALKTEEVAAAAEMSGKEKEKYEALDEKKFWELRKIGAANKLVALLKNNDSLKYHFLHPLPSFKGGFINFQKIHHVNLNKEYMENYDMIASVTTKFTKDIISRFSHYYSRQGQPNIDLRPIIGELLKQ